MINFDFSEKCYGCRACENICPVAAIQMNEDGAGFLYPVIEQSKCIQCGLCDTVCPHLNTANNRSDTSCLDAWLYASKKDDVKLRSASGGAFYELAHKALDDGYAIVGCVWNDELNAEHIVGYDEIALQRMQGSKYVQSDTRNCYSQLKELLISGKKVLFSGTPCQVEAAHNIAMALEKGKYREQLITIGLICHGVAAPKSWSSYKEYIENKQNSKLLHVNFRNKEREGYKKSYCKYEFQSGEVTYLPTFLPSSKYMEATLVYNLAMRKSCSQCACKGPTSACDIILGDWYAEYTGEGKLGTSCIVAFTEHGKNAVLHYLEGIRAISYPEIVEQNGFIEKSVQLGTNRDKFLANLDDIDMWEDVEKLYPSKYRLKKILVKLKVFDFIKRIIK